MTSRLTRLPIIKAGWILTTLIGAAVGVVAVACESSTDNGGPLGPDGGGFDVITSGDGSVNVVDGGGDATFDGPLPALDRFRHQWPVTADQPDTTSYIVDADAGIVTDKVTGLTWTRDLLHQESTTFDAGDGPGLLATDTQATARAACANATVGGLSGWRLPTMAEMLTIVSFNNSDWNNSTAFVDTSYGAQYFTDSNEPDIFLVYDNHYHPWTFRFGTGLASIRCVRSPYAVTAGPEAPLPGRFTMKSGTAVDNVTKLEWQLSISSELQLYGQAQTYCSGLAAGNDAGVPTGGGAWRVPSVKELATIWNEGTGGIEPTVFGEVQTTNYLWTSNTYWGTQSIPDANKNIRMLWQPGNKKFFTWETNQAISYTKCVRNAP